MRKAAPNQRSKAKAPWRGNVPQLRSTSDARALRLLRLYDTLSHGLSQSALEVCKTLNISRRTFFRDVKLLTRAGHVYSFDRTTQTRRAVNANRAILDNLLADEIDSLLLGLQALCQMRITTTPNAARSARIKLLRALPEAMRDRRLWLEGKIRIQTEDLGVDGIVVRDAFEEIRDAMVRYRNVEIEYGTEGPQRTTAIVSPRCLVYRKIAWHVLVSHGRASGLQSIALHEITRCTATTKDCGVYGGKCLVDEIEVLCQGDEPLTYVAEQAGAGHSALAAQQSQHAWIQAAVGTNRRV